MSMHKVSVIFTPDFNTFAQGAFYFDKYQAIYIAVRKNGTDYLVSVDGGIFYGFCSEKFSRVPVGTVIKVVVNA